MDITMVLFEKGRGAAVSEMPTLPLDGGRWLWVDLAGEIDADTRQVLQGVLGVSKLAVQDASRTRHPPKVEVLENYLFLLLREIGSGEAANDIELSQVSLFLNEHILITVHKPESAIVEAAKDRFLDGGRSAANPAQVAYVICRNLVETCEPVVLSHEEALATIEDDLFDRSDDKVLESLSRLNRTLRRLRRVMSYQAALFDQVRSRVKETVVPFSKHEVTDLFENMDRLASLCQLNQENAVDLFNTHLGIMSHRLNVVMRVLTIATIIFMPLGLLAGIYGMNFEIMPELSWEYGYFAVLGTMVTVAAVLFVFFKLKRWL